MIASLRRSSLEAEERAAALEREIVARKMMEKELRRAKDAAETANVAKSQFLSNMGHELRTPLNAVIGYVELLHDNIYGDVPEKIWGVLHRVEKNGRHLLNLINEVLDIARMETGRLTLSVGEYSMGEIAQSVATSFEKEAAEKRLALKVTVASDLPHGYGDQQRLTQVVTNLVGNAIKFTETGRVQVDVHVSEGNFLVSVTDTGPGIAVADQQRIFEPFGQIDTSKTRKGGAGLGLSIARRIVELHSGRIWIDFNLGRRFDLPVHRADPRRAAIGDPMSKCILLIEDQEDNRRIVRDLLASVGYDLIEALTGEDGVVLAERHRPDLILMDVLLPGLDGYEATRLIKAKPELRHIPIIAVTSYALSGDDTKAMEAGCDAYIAKPFSPRELLAKIREFLPAEV